jgi:hypothetical protein
MARERMVDTLPLLELPLPPELLLVGTMTTLLPPLASRDSFPAVVVVSPSSAGTSVDRLILLLVLHRGQAPQSTTAAASWSALMMTRCRSDGVHVGISLPRFFVFPTSGRLLRSPRESSLAKGRANSCPFPF